MSPAAPDLEALDAPVEGTMWIPYIDLLAGTVAVLILFFVGLKVQEVRREQAAQAGVGQTLDRIRQQLAQEGKAQGIQFEKDRMLLPAGAFESLSPRPSELCREQLQVMGREILLELRKQPRLRVLIEGHTDSLPMTRTYTTEDGAFNDNYSLSAARANASRRILTQAWEGNLPGRAGIAGYGPDRPLEGRKPEDPLNRRVEIRLELDTPEQPKGGVS